MRAKSKTPSNRREDQEEGEEEVQASSSTVNPYGPAVMLVHPGRQNRKWAQTRPYTTNYQSRLPNGLLSLAHNCIRIVPFPLRRLLTKAFRFIFLVILMVTVIVNILFIIDTRNRLQQQQQRQLANGDGIHYGDFENEISESGERKSIKVEIVSSHSRVMCTVDSTIILDDAEEGSNRGIHILVLNQMTGAIMARRHFDTYSPHEDESMTLFLSMLSDERIVLFAIKDEGTFQLKKAARDLLTRMGSRRAEQLSWRDMWAMVVRKRLLTSSGGTPSQTPSSSLLGESYTKASDFNSWASPAILNVEIELSSESEDLCQWGRHTTTPSSLLGHILGGILPTAGKELTATTLATSERRTQQEVNSGSMFLPDDETQAQRRASFCSRIEGYGSVCSCNDPMPLRFVSSFDPMAPISQVPIAVIASNRPAFLYRMLRSLIPLCNPSMITVFIDGYYEEPLEIAKLFGLRGIQHTPIGQRNARISQHYKASLTATFNLYPDAEAVIVLEEDLDVSADIFAYFGSTMSLLDADPTLFCISAWNDLAYEHTSSDGSLLYRVETMPGLGWMMRRKLYKDELETNWPTPDKLWDWDIWMRLPEIRKGRECIVPDVPRTFHFGSSGLNMNSFFQDAYFKKHAFNTDPSARVNNVNSLKRDNYERLLTKLIRQAILVDHSKSPCEGHFLRQHSKASLTPNASLFSSGPLGEGSASGGASKPYLVFIRMSTHNDYETWLQMAKCLHIWDLDARGFHRGLVRLHLHGAQLLVIGTPYSPYSVFKPPHVVPISLSKPLTPLVAANRH